MNTIKKSNKELNKYNIDERMMKVYKKSLSVIYFSQKGQWYKTVNNMSSVPYSYDYDTAVEVMEILQNNVNTGDGMGFERAKGILNRIEDTNSKRHIMTIVAKFSNYGQALYTEVIKDLDSYTRNCLEEIRVRNHTESCIGHGVAYRLHEKWRNSRLREDFTYKPAWRTIKDSQFIKALNKSNNLPNTIRKIDNKYEMDIANTDYNGLSSDLQYENQEAGKVAAGLFIRSLDEHLTNEFIGAEIQSEWRKRNAWAKGSDLDVPLLKYYFTDIGLRNARLNFRQQEESHIMENVIFNELKTRGFDIDVGVVEMCFKDEHKQTQRKQLEIDFVVNKGSSRYYIQSAMHIDDENKRLQETGSLNRIDDSFKKIVIVKDEIIHYHDDKGILYLGLQEFLLKDEAIDW